MLWGTGVESGNVLQLGNATSGAEIRTVTPSPRTGNYYFSVTSYVRRTVPVVTSEIYVAAGAYPSSWTIDRNRIFVYMDTGNSASLRWNQVSKCYDAYVGNTLVAAGTVTVVEATWHHVEMYVKVGGAGTGRIVSYVEGNLDVDYTGATDFGGTATLVANIAWRGNGGAAYWDDVCFGTGGWPGDRRFDVALVPTADVSNSWELSAGSDAYALIDEVPPSDADYIFMEKDFSVTITDNTESISDAFQSGEVYAANGDAVPDVGDRFLVGGTGDFIGDELATAKGGAPAAGDIFEVTNNGVGTEAVSYVDRLAQFTLTDWNGDDKIPLAVTIWGRALKSEALGHTLRLTADDGALTLGNAQNLLTSASYVYRIMETQPTSGDPWDEVAINALEIGVRGDLV